MRQQNNNHRYINILKYLFILSLTSFAFSYFSSIIVVIKGCLTSDPNTPDAVGISVEKDEAIAVSLPGLKLLQQNKSCHQKKKKKRRQKIENKIFTSHYVIAIRRSYHSQFYCRSCYHSLRNAMLRAMQYGTTGSENCQY